MNICVDGNSFDWVMACKFVGGYIQNYSICVVIFKVRRIGGQRKLIKSTLLDSPRLFQVQDLSK